MKYCDCGHLLLLAVEDATVVLPTGEEIPFRRTTDYVSCERCLRSFAIAELRKRSDAPSPEDLPAP